MGKQRKAGMTVVISLLCMVLFAGCGRLREAFEVRREIQENQPFTSPADPETENMQSISDMQSIPDDMQSISDGNYAYECLGEEGQKIYDQMLQTILNYQEKTMLATMDTELMRQAYQALISDYGGLFWVEGYVFTSYTRGDRLIGLEFAPTYVMDEQQKNEVQSQVDAVVDEWLGGISIHDSDYEKAKYVFETLIENVDYVGEARDNQNILSVFLYQQTVCQGYACATQYLLRQVGIPSTIVSGYANGQAHAWNLVKLDGSYYHMDTTWGNSTYLDTDSREEKFVNYNYLCMTDREISLTHQPDMMFTLPECSSMEDNYYVREGRYFESWDPEAIGEAFREAWNSGEASVAVKCADDKIYHNIKEYFIGQQKISDYCAGMEYVYYMEAPELYVFTVNFN